jgi:hypothetical protein
LASNIDGSVQYRKTKSCARCNARRWRLPGAPSCGSGHDFNHEFFFTRKTFGKAHPQVVDVVLHAARHLYAEAATGPIMGLQGRAKGPAGSS